MTRKMKLEFLIKEIERAFLLQDKLAPALWCRWGRRKWSVGYKNYRNRVLSQILRAERIVEQYSYILHRYIHLIEVAKFIRERPSSLLVFFSSKGVQYEGEGLLHKLLVSSITGEILNYLEDPVITNIILYGTEGSIKFDVTKRIMDELKGSFYKIIRVKLFPKTSVRNLQHEIAMQLKVTLPANKDEEMIASRISEILNHANKCLFIFDGVYNCKPEVLNKIGIPQLKLRNTKLLSTTGPKLTNYLLYMYNYYSFYKLDKKMHQVMDELRVLRTSESSPQVLYDIDGADRLPGKVSSRQRNTSKSRQEDGNKIWGYLLDPVIGTIGLYGIEGVGKTTLVKNICTELASTDTFDKIIWVSVGSLSDDPREPDQYIRLQDQVAMQLGINLVQFDGLGEREYIISENLKIVGKCLFILDDVQESFSLSILGIREPITDYYGYKIMDDVQETFSLSDPGIPEPITACSGCKTMLVTRSRHVCTNMGVDKQINLAPLSNKEAWDLFVSRLRDEVLDPEIETIAKDIVHKCGGLPISIVTVSHAMRNETNPTAWRLALKDLRSTPSSIYSEDIYHEKGMVEVLDVLAFGYSRLKNDEMRKCFLCCAIFPENYKFESKELIRYWMAHDYINNEGGIVQSINDGQEILEELKSTNMFETFTEGGIERLKMHNLFRDFAIIIMKLDLWFFVKAGVGLISFEGERYRRVSLIRNKISVLNKFHRPLTYLSSLSLRENLLRHVSYDFFYSMPNLQVLDLSYSGIQCLPPSLVELQKLRVLFLNFCTGMDKLPSLEKLRDLQVLNLCGTLIEELPQGMEELVNLKSLDLSETVRLRHIRAGVISSLSKLEELRMQGSRLCKMESPEAANCFKEIRSLKQLGILTLSTVGFGDHLDTVLHLQQYNLKSFSINAYGSVQDYIEDE